jgi:dynein heavy chain, axonemal
VKEPVTNTKLQRIIFTHFISRDNQGEKASNYSMVEDLVVFEKKLKDFLEVYNNENKKQMNLVLFKDACDHVSRISRILNQPQGHGLLLGIGGSGRQSLTRLAAHIGSPDGQSYKVMQIEVGKGYKIQSWRDDLKNLIKYAVQDNKQFCFLFTDLQIISEQMIEDLNCLMNSGQIAGVNFIGEEKK